MMLQVFNMGRCLRWPMKTLTEWLRNSRNGMRSGNHLAGGASSTKTRTLTRTMTGTSTSTRRLRGPLANTRSRLKTTWKGELPCQISGPVHCSGVLGLSTQLVLFPGFFACNLWSTISFRNVRKEKLVCNGVRMIACTTSSISKRGV